LWSRATTMGKQYTNSPARGHLHAVETAPHEGLTNDLDPFEAVLSENDQQGPLANNLDPMETLLPEYDGQGRPIEYTVALRKVETKKTPWGRSTWWVTFEILDMGPHFGRPLLMFINIPEEQRIARGSTVFSAFAVATGMRPPRYIAQRGPAWFLKECTFAVRVRAVTKDKHQVERARAASYSVVECLVKRIDGVPPALQGRAS